MLNDAKSNINRSRRGSRLKPAVPGRVRASGCRLKPAVPGGFTLVEVLVATVLLATGLLGALTAFSMASRVMGVATTDTTLTLLAQEKLADVEVLGREALVKAPTAGDFGADNPGYRWEMIVNDPDELNVVRVDVVIYAPKLGGTREVWFSTSVF